jgi:hypothetical protein
MSLIRPKGHNMRWNMEKRNVYKAKSICQPVLGHDLALVADAQRREREHLASIKTLARQGFSHDGIEHKAIYKKSEHGTIVIKKGA